MQLPASDGELQVKPIARETTLSIRQITERLLILNGDEERVEGGNGEGKNVGQKDEGAYLLGNKKQKV